MKSVPYPEEGPRWPGLCADFHRAVVELGATPDGIDLRRRAEERFMYAENKPFLLGPPQLIRAEWADRLRRVTRAYHSCIENVISASRADPIVQATLSNPPELQRDFLQDHERANDRVHILRLDLLLATDGGFKILETNANCPGGFVFAGICNRAWREFLEGQGRPMPPALRHESHRYMAEWFLEVIQQETNDQPDYLPLLREKDGNRFELTDFAHHVRDLGIDCDEVDPRALKYDGRVVSTERGRPVRAGYLKLGMQRFLRLRSRLEPFVAGVRERALFVQNGQRGRWVGDDKLCLAIISDPAFSHLFDPEDLATLAEHIPWSRNASRLTGARLKQIRSCRSEYVLKRGLDTRGAGVVVGREVDERRWGRAVDEAVSNSWLVQEFHETSWIERDFDSNQKQRHDVALGAINGELTTLFMRSSGEMRVNMARTGRMHPLFLGG